MESDEESSDSGDKCEGGESSDECVESVGGRRLTREMVVEWVESVQTVRHTCTRVFCVLAQTQPVDMLVTMGTIVCSRQLIVYVEYNTSLFGAAMHGLGSLPKVKVDVHVLRVCVCVCVCHCVYVLQVNVQ